MKAGEARLLVGQWVYVWTALHGEYRAILREVTDDKPWRGKVELSTMLVWPASGHRGYAPGTIIRVGNSSIKPL
jgi:hypothetical protein